MIVAISLLGLAMTGQAPSPEGSSAVAEKMKALAFLVGEWEGQGWMQAGPGPRVDATIKESVRLRLSGNAVLIEGLGTAKSAEGGGERVVHEAIALITWDVKKGRYIMHAMTARAGHVEPTIEVGDKSIVWSFETGGGKIRYTINVDEKGRWTEVGDFSRDGTAWNKFFEMTLTKKGS